MIHIQTYPVPEDILADERLTLEVRSEGGEWTHVPLMHADSMSEQPHANGGAEAFALIGIEAPVQFRARFPESVQHAILRPSMRTRVAVETEGNQVYGQIDAARRLSLEVNHIETDGAPSKCARFTLYLLFEAIAPVPFSADDPSVTVLAPGCHAPEVFAGRGKRLLLMPGVHNVSSQMLTLDSDTTLYLSGGAHLRSYVHSIETENVSILGPGIIDGTGVANKTREWRDDGDAAFVLFREGKNILFDGPVIYDSAFWNLVLHGGSDITIRNYKSICWKMNNDGVQPRNCENFLVEDCFLKCADDCIAIKSRRTAKLYHGGQTYRRLICWNDIPGNAVEIGHTSQAKELSQVRFEDIDVIHGECNEAIGKCVISIFLVDGCHVHNIQYTGFRVEGYQTLGEFGIRVSKSKYSTDENRGRIENITISDYIQEAPPSHSWFDGYDATNRVKAIQLQSLNFEGKHIYTLNELPHTLKFAKDITLVQSE